MVELDLIESEKYWSISIFVDKPVSKYDALKQAVRKILQEIYRLDHKK